MKIEFYGVRGTAPVSSGKAIHYGGHTTCTCIVASDGKVVIVDAGTGIMALGARLLRDMKTKKVRLHVLLTHFHLDHIIGLPFFSPLYSPEAEIVFHSTAGAVETEKHLKRLMGGRFFPLDFSRTESAKVFEPIEDRSFSLGGLRISWCPLRHPQGSAAFRIEESGKSVVFSTDTEHPEEGLDEELASLARGASVLIYDATYTPDEYEAGKKGWGHSTWLEGTKIARAAGVRRLFLSHYNPGHTDKKIVEIVSLARREFLRTSGAREGLKIVI